MKDVIAVNNHGVNHNTLHRGETIGLIVGVLVEIDIMPFPIFILTAVPENSEHCGDVSDRVETTRHEVKRISPICLHVNVWNQTSNIMDVQHIPLRTALYELHSIQTM